MSRNKRRLEKRKNIFLRRVCVGKQFRGLTNSLEMVTTPVIIDIYVYKDESDAHCVRVFFKGRIGKYWIIYNEVILRMLLIYFNIKVPYTRIYPKYLRKG